MTDETGNNVTPYIANLLGRNLCAATRPAPTRPAPVPTRPPTNPRTPAHTPTRTPVPIAACAPPLVRRSHRTENHPLGIIKFKIEEYFNRHMLD